MHDLLHKGKKLIDEKYSPDGYNFGVNCNECAGQTVMHVHMHLIPRYKGDTKFVHGGSARCNSREDVRSRKITQRYQSYKTL